METVEIPHAPDDGAIRSAWTIRPVTLRFLGAGTVFLLFGLVPASLYLASGNGFGPWAAAGFYLAMVIVAARALEKGYPHARLGVCNLITLFRAALIGSFAIPVLWPAGLSDPRHAWLILAIAVFTLALDGVDGYFARKEKLVSSFGARFDMEVDAVFALALAIIAFHLDKAGPWVILLGFARYMFVAATYVWPWLDGPLPERFSRKLVCVIQIGVLIAMMAPIVTPPVSYGLAAIATVLLIWSFGVDIVWRKRNRA
ncbi:CDP-alcohol phosphatidyltransferase family protein [Arsenicitalea aurantiaca]|uniref:CDP-alcohol phosphatidyltransferase family protein n=1 Tax=Arsenicitalea aurantiaca TaxID=1783274 RepID=A0A433X3D2_9HYPH|nr:CDP-alcohol phosphatidyltransferase family protein [Arsenicitalea aurantiaca]RUT28570.1 CDP-alcohol phosphatidyltransferase family protein [Arsenicitalea aurantiaca]